MEGKELKSLPEPSLDADASFSSDEGGDGFQTSGLRGQQRAGWSIAGWPTEPSLDADAS